MNKIPRCLLEHFGDETGREVFSTELKGGCKSFGLFLGGRLLTLDCYVRYCLLHL